MKVPKVINPLTGNSMSLSPGSILSLIGGALLLLFSITAAQKIGSKVEQKTSLLDFSPDPLTRAEVKVANSKAYFG